LVSCRDVLLKNRDRQKKPLTEVIDAYTMGAAYASFDEHRKGSLKKGASGFTVGTPNMLW
jgi:predicted amidohydrolase YtcJ